MEEKCLFKNTGKMEEKLKKKKTVRRGNMKRSYHMIEKINVEWNGRKVNKED